MSITINGQTSPAAEFAWDGCHKIYLLDNGDADKNGKYGYMLSKNGEAGYKVLPVSELQRVWDQSCPLRFINNWALDKNMFPNATRSPSPSKRVERENHEIIQDIRGRIRSGYRSRPMGVQPLRVTRYVMSEPIGYKIAFTYLGQPVHLSSEWKTGVAEKSFREIVNIRKAITTEANPELVPDKD